MDEKEKRKQRRLLRKQRKQEEKREQEKPKIIENCIVCGEPVKSTHEYRRLPPDSKNPNWRYYHINSCGPGTEVWYKFHPSENAKRLMMRNDPENLKNLEKKLHRYERKLRRKGGEGERGKRYRRMIAWLKAQIEGRIPVNSKPEFPKGGNTMGKKDKEEKKAETKEEEKPAAEEKKAGNPNLKPMEAVKVPKELRKKQPEAVQKLIKELEGMERSSKEAQKIRKQLRALGFRLSDVKNGEQGVAVPPKEEKAEKKEKKADKKQEKPEEVEEVDDNDDDDDDD